MSDNLTAREAATLDAAEAALLDEHERALREMLAAQIVALQDLRDRMEHTPALAELSPEERQERAAQWAELLCTEVGELVDQVRGGRPAHE